MRIKQSDIVLRTPSCTLTLLLFTKNLPQFTLMFLDHPCGTTLILTETSTGSFVIFSNNVEGLTFWPFKSKLFKLASRILRMNSSVCIEACSRDCGCSVNGKISSLIYVLFLVTKSVTEITQLDCVDTVTGNFSKGSTFMFLSLFSTIMHYYYYYHHHHHHHRISHFQTLAGKYSPILRCSNQQD